MYMTISAPSFVRLSSQSGLVGPMNWTIQSCLPLVTLWRRFAGAVGTPFGVAVNASGNPLCTVPTPFTLQPLINLPTSP